MEKYSQSQGISRRSFLQTGSVLAASALVMPMGGFRAWGLNNMAKQAIPHVKLNNGIQMPVIGFGTNTLNGSICERSVSDAISVGYRLVDTAKVYGNEESVGAGIKNSGIKRDELFVTSKLWVDDSGYEQSKKAFETTLSKLQLDYLDLYIIHRPRGDVKGSGKAMEELYSKGKIRAIGLSNFEPDQLSELLGYAQIKPAINQIETHVFFQEQLSYDFLKKGKIQMEAWSPFAAGRNGIFENKVMAEIGAKHKKSIAQVFPRWHFKKGVVAIPRSTQKAHMIENLDIFDFELESADIEVIEKLDLNRTQFPEWS